jgi:hypothetical protein
MLVGSMALGQGQSTPVARDVGLLGEILRLNVGAVPSVQPDLATVTVD